MFKNQFQGGPFVEIFSCQGKEPLSKWKLTGSSIQKVYEKEVKSYVYSLEGSSTTTKMHLPRDTKQTLALIQRYLVVQLNTPAGAALSIELGILDSSNNKRRLLFSTAQKEISITPLHVKLPLLVLRRRVWLNLCLDLLSVVQDAFRGQTFKSLDSITISASCRVRKIFTLKSQPQDSTDDDDIYAINPPTNSTETDIVPRSCQFPFDVVHQTQVINMSKLRHAELKLRPDSSRPPSTSDLDLNSSMKSNKGDRPMHIAFGSKVPVPHTSHGRKASAGQVKEGSATSRSSRSAGQRKHEPPTPASQGSQKDGHNRMRLDPGSELNDPGLGVGKVTTKTWSTGVNQPSEKESVHQPRPPRQKSADKSRRVVKVRPNSGKDKTGAPASKNGDQNEKIEGDIQGYDPRRYTSRGRGDTWYDIDPNKRVSEPKYENIELRSSTEVKVTTHFGDEGGKEIASESSENFSVTESDRVSDATDDLNVSERDKGPSRVSSEVREGNKRSRLPKKKRKQGGKGLGLMDSLSENEEVRCSLKRVRDIRRLDAPATDSGVGLTGSGTSAENVSSLDEDESNNDGDTDRTEKDSSLYTFTSPPRSAPNRQKPGRGRGVDQKILQAKLKQIQDTSKPSGTGTDGEADLNASLTHTDFTKSALDESLSDDQYRNILRNTPSPRPGHSPLPKNGVMSGHGTTAKLDKDPQSEASSDSSEGFDDSQSNSPVISRSPTLPRGKFNNGGKAVHFSGRKDVPPHPQSSEISPRGAGIHYSGQNVVLSKPRSSKPSMRGAGECSSGPGDTMPQPRRSNISPRGVEADSAPRSGAMSQSLSSDVSPRGAGQSLSRLSIQASKVKEIPKRSPRLSDEEEDWRNYKSNSSSLASSLEAKMLASLKREQLELYEDENRPPVENSFELHNYGDDDLSSSSDDTTTTFSTWKPPEVKKGNHRIQDEMHFPRNPLQHSNPRDWGSIFSPPIVLPSEKMKDGSFVDQLSPAKVDPQGSDIPQSSTGSDAGSVGVVTGPSVTDDEEELDLLYDPCLNCYFDPVTGKYYKLA